MEPLCDLVCCEFVVIFDYFFLLFLLQKTSRWIKNSGQSCADGKAIGTDPLM